MPPGPPRTRGGRRAARGWRQASSIIHQPQGGSGRGQTTTRGRRSWRRGFPAGQFLGTERSLSRGSQRSTLKNAAQPRWAGLVEGSHLPHPLRPAGRPGACALLAFRALFRADSRIRLRPIWTTAGQREQSVPKMTNRCVEGVRVPPPRDSRPHPRPVPPTRASCGCVSRPRFPGGRWLRSPASQLGGVPALPPRRAGGAGVSLRLWLRLLFRLGGRRVECCAVGLSVSPLCLCSSPFHRCY